MASATRYQVFLSSTYEDLRLERQQATQAILESGNFPAGMELFPAADDNQWELIKQVISESDYYIVIVSGKYGSIGPSGLSYTEMEYNYAHEIGIPIIGYVRDNIDNIASRFVESDPERRRMLEAFRAKVMTRMCKKFAEPTELGMFVLRSLIHESRVRPRLGWVRGNQAMTDEDRQRELKLVVELEEARKQIKKLQAEARILQREIRDRSLLVDAIPREKLSQGSDQYIFNVFFYSANKEYNSVSVAVTWDEIFSAIGPSLYGYILRKVSNNGYSFEEDLENVIRSKIVDRVQKRKIDIQRGQVDTCVIHLKELGLLQFTESDAKEGDIFRGVTLTEAGEQYLTKLKIQLR